jgi:hypothetical protein
MQKGLLTNLHGLLAISAYLSKLQYVCMVDGWMLLLELFFFPDSCCIFAVAPYFRPSCVVLAEKARLLFYL